MAFDQNLRNHSQLQLAFAIEARERIESKVEAAETPQQMRAEATFASIIEAAARILEEAGLEGYSASLSESGPRCPEFISLASSLRSPLRLRKILFPELLSTKRPGAIVVLLQLAQPDAADFARNGFGRLGDDFHASNALELRKPLMQMSEDG